MAVTLTTTGIQFPDSSIQTSAAGASKVVQIVAATTTTEVNVNASWADSGVTATITPTSASNKILLMINTNIASGSPSASNYPDGYYKVMRAATEIVTAPGKSTIKMWSAPAGSGTETLAVGSLAISYLDSPATTSPTTYKLQGYSNNNLRFQWGGGAGTIVLMEVTP